MIMKHMLNIINKELGKVFKNPKLVFSTLLLPGILIFAMYSFMGSSIRGEGNKIKDYEYKLVQVGDSSAFTSVLEQVGQTGDALKIEVIPFDTFVKSTEFDSYSFASVDEWLKEVKNDSSSLKTYINKNIEDKKITGVIYIDKKFDEALHPSLNVEKSVEISILKTSSNQYSQALASYVNTILDTVGKTYQQITPIFAFDTLDLTPADSQANSTLAMLIPMLLITFIFAGALSISCDAIAGEKERGTISTLLMAPIKKDEILLGKIISMIILTIVSSIVSFLGMALSLIKNGAVFGLSDGLKLSYGPSTYIELFMLILLATLFAVSLFLIASTIAKDTREANMYAMPFYIVAIISGVLAMFNFDVPQSIFPYFIPVYNIILGMKGVLMCKLSLVNFFVITLSTIIYFVIILQIVKKLFHSEKIMFGK